ncbi:serine hydrolase domain-containing protein [Paenibacillus assamensis]|uniref:serine hydrolase domain-containing protein n=1 Tax=Paenibacillus assamensis TaxID=311244 RepID=UPI0003FD0547|nr:serine hydrolase domain-containing protein [Paenibacillus assamensis]
MTFEQTIISLKDKYHVPGVAVSIVSRSGDPKMYCSGWANKKDDIYISEKTKFQVASVSKPVTALGIMKLVEQGDVDLDKAISHYVNRWSFPPSPYDTNKITIRQLLSHTSGLNSPLYLGTTVQRNPYHIEHSMNGSMNRKTRLKVIREPGTVFSYSGGGYSLLQLLIEEVSNMSFSSFMEKNIFEPLGMNNSSFEHPIRPMNQIAKCYDSLGRVLPDYLYIEKAAAGLYSTVEDMSKFAACNLRMSSEEGSDERDFIQSKYAKLLYTRVERSIPHSLGFSMLSINNHKVFFYTGLNRGWNSIIILVPKCEEGLVILTNSNIGGNFIYDVTKLWLESLIGSVSEYYTKRMRISKNNRLFILMKENWYNKWG